VDVKRNTGHIGVFFGESIGCIAHNDAGSRGEIIVVPRDILKIGEDVVKIILYVTAIINGD
jgi:hypothetical protein